MQKEEGSANPRLRHDPEGLVLASADGMELRVDLTRMLPRLRPDRLACELLVRAAKVKGALAGGAPTAVDATAGLGEDALLLAAAGFEVTLVERDPTIFALLADALGRAATEDALAVPIARMHLIQGNSLQVLAGLSASPDVIYLDPMFPARRKSAAVKKKFQMLHQLEPPCEEQEELLAAACAAAPRKVVIKRPARGEPLAGRHPSYSIRGKSVRYDVIVAPHPLDTVPLGGAHGA